MQYTTIKEKRYENIYRSFQNEVYRVSLYYTKDIHTAQDITQKVFYQFYHHAEQVKEECIRAYLISSAKNLSYNWLRDRKREVHGEYLDILPEEDMPQYSAEDEYIKAEQNQEQRVFISKVLESLRKENESWYQIVSLIFCLEKPHDVVAKELGISKDVLYSKLYRAKKWIRKNFEDEYKNL